MLSYQIYVYLESQRTFYPLIIDDVPAVWNYRKLSAKFLGSSIRVIDTVGFLLFFKSFTRTTIIIPVHCVPKKLRISKKDNSSFCRIPNPADSKSWGIQEFCKTLNDFPGIPVKIHKSLGKFMDFQSGSPSNNYEISNVVDGVFVRILSGIAQWITTMMSM